MFVAFIYWLGDRFSDWKNIVTLYSVRTHKVCGSFLVVLRFHILSCLIGTRVLFTGVRRSELEADHPTVSEFASRLSLLKLRVTVVFLYSHCPLHFYFIKRILLRWSLVAILFRSNGKRLDIQKTVPSPLFCCSAVIYSKMETGKNGPT